MPPQSGSAFVLTSSVRREIVSQLAHETTPTGALLTTISASESAIYDALSTLTARGLCFEAEDGWELTAHGQLVADLTTRWQATDDFLEHDPAYWNTHRVDIVPPTFRRRLPEVGAYEIVRDSPREPDKHEAVIIDRLRRADRCQLATSFYSRQFEAVIPNSPETRMLTTRAVASIAAARYTEGLRETLVQPAQSVCRLTRCQFTFVVTDDCLLFRLPVTASAAESSDLDGGYSLTETTATFIAETDSGVQWGRDLFGSLWEQSDPLEPYLERECPELIDDW